MTKEQLRAERRKANKHAGARGERARAKAPRTGAKTHGKGDGTTPADPLHDPRATDPHTRVRFLPAALGVALALFTLLGGGPDVPAFRWTLIVAGGALVLWNAQLLTAPAYRGRGLRVDVDLRKQHYVQACAHASIFLYWGYYVPWVRDVVPLLVVQLLFAYGFDLLLSWTRRRAYTLGFGPFPVVFSTNLFLWFKPEWFYFQFLMIAVGFAAKELIRWNREGRKVHVFNPSSFPLALASLLLIATASAHITFGPEIASSQGIPPHMYLLLFAVALPGQILFGVAAMTVSAVLTTYLFGLVFLGINGTYYFFDCYIPIPVFLGMHLLFTDPSTAPRTELGRIAFGAMYGLSTVALYQLLLSLGAPSFYDKLLQVPLMNLTVRAIDRAVRTRWLQVIDPGRIGRALTARKRHLAYTGLWATTFVILKLVDGVGDHHRGQYLPFWMDTCSRGNERACAYLAVVEQQMCGAGSGWACNEAAVLGSRSYGGITSTMDPERREAAFRVGCTLGNREACHNGVRLRSGNTDFERGEPSVHELPIVLHGSRFGPITDTRPEALYARGCAQGWPGMCERQAAAVPH
jgi:hypothetical protein